MVSKGGRRSPFGSGSSNRREKRPVGMGFQRGTAFHLAHDFPQESLVCYTFMKQTEYENDECPVETRFISVFFRCERLIPQREKLEQRKGTGEVTYVTEPVPARSAE